jgi:hypothetical protein
MWYVLLADAVAFVHLLFVVFVMFGALFVLRWPQAVWIHAPACVWGLIVEWSGTVCPLTPLENWLRRLAGESGYSEGFLSHWLGMVLYPTLLTRSVQAVLGASLLLWNLALYWWIWRRRLHRSDARSRSA